MLSKTTIEVATDLVWDIDEETTQRFNLPEDEVESFGEGSVIS